MSLASNVSRPVDQIERDGSTASQRKFITFDGMVLESGVVLPEVTVAYETFGKFNGSNAVLIEHALTGDSHVAGQSLAGQQSGWWNDLVGSGKSVDTDEWFVICANVLGGCQGTTGPSSPNPADGFAWGSRWPRISVRDQVSLEVMLADGLGITKFAAMLGGSMGGMRTLEWLVMHPGRVGAALLLATSARASADQVGTQTVQIAAITNDAQWNNGDYYALGVGRGPKRGLAIARQIAQLTYRTQEEFDERFGLDAQGDENPYGRSIPGRDLNAG